MPLQKRPRQNCLLENLQMFTLPIVAFSRNQIIAIPMFFVSNYIFSDWICTGGFLVISV
jgi:hypothetical protein